VLEFSQHLRRAIGSVRTVRVEQQEYNLVVVATKSGDAKCS
jgi:hypothetical protein